AVGMRAEPVYVGVDAGNKRSSDPFGVRPVRRPLLLHVTAIKKEPRRSILLHVSGTEHLRQHTQATPAPKINLKKPVAGRVEALCEEAIVEILRIDVRYTPFIDKNFGGLSESSNLKRRRRRFRSAGCDCRSDDCKQHGDREMLLQSGHEQ